MKSKKVVREEAHRGGSTSPSPLLFATATLTLILLSVVMSAGDDSALGKDSLFLYSEWSPDENNEPSDYFFSEEFRNDDDQDEHWLMTEWRNLKRGGGGGSSSSSRSSRNRSYGNCYGDRCDDVGVD